jgi:hypothetical protein
VAQDSGAAVARVACCRASGKERRRRVSGEEVQRHLHAANGGIIAFDEVVLLEELRLIDERQQRRVHAGPIGAAGRVHAVRRQAGVDADANLPQVRNAQALARGLSRALHGWQQQREQQANDGQHDDQLDQQDAAAVHGTTWSIACTPARGRLLRNSSRWPAVYTRGQEMCQLFCIWRGPGDWRPPLADGRGAAAGASG